MCLIIYTMHPNVNYKENYLILWYNTPLNFITGTTMPTYNVFIDTTNDFSKIYSLSYFDSPHGKDYSKRNITMKVVAGEVFCSPMRKRDYLNPCKILGAVRFTHWIESTRNIDSENLFMNSTTARDMLTGGEPFAKSMKVYNECHELEEIDGGGHSKLKPPDHWREMFVGNFKNENLFLFHENDEAFNPSDSLRTQTSRDLLEPMQGIEQTDAPEVKVRSERIKDLETSLLTFRYTPLGNLSFEDLAMKHREDGTPVYYVNYGLAKFKRSYKADQKSFANYIDSLSVVPIRHKKLSAVSALDILSFSRRVESGMLNFVGARGYL